MMRYQDTYIGQPGEQIFFIKNYSAFWGAKVEDVEDNFFAFGSKNADLKTNSTDPRRLYDISWIDVLYGGKGNATDVSAVYQYDGFVGLSCALSILAFKKDKSYGNYLKQ